MSKYQNILNEPNLLDLSKKIFNAALNEDFYTENKEKEGPRFRNPSMI